MCNNKCMWHYELKYIYFVKYIVGWIEDKRYKRYKNIFVNKAFSKKKKKKNFCV